MKITDECKNNGVEKDEHLLSKICSLAVFYALKDNCSLILGLVFHIFGHHLSLVFN